MISRKLFLQLAHSVFYLKKLLKSWFDEIFFGDSKFFILPYCVAVSLFFNSQCGNFRIFLSLRFSVKSFLDNLEARFCHFTKNLSSKKMYLPQCWFDCFFHTITVDHLQKLQHQNELMDHSWLQEDYPKPHWLWQ